MAKEMGNGEFWLPSDFLDDFLVESTPKLATSPQSTLHGLGGRSFSSGGGGSPEAPSTPFTKMGDDLLEALYEEVIRKESVQEKAALIQQQLRTAQFYQLKRQQLMKLQLQQQQFAAVALGRSIKSRSRGAYGAPPPNSTNGSGMRAVFLNGSNGKRESTGTGVFLPRRAGAPNEPRKKSGCSTVLLPARVVQALNLNLSEMRLQPRLPTGYVLDHDALKANLPKRSHHYPEQQPAQAAGHEIRLPQEWTY